MEQSPLQIAGYVASIYKASKVKCTMDDICYTLDISRHEYDKHTQNLYEVLDSHSKHYNVELLKRVAEFTSQCAWCKKIISRGYTGKVTHTMCDICLKKREKQNEKV